jgi:hypothetical protein
MTMRLLAGVLGGLVLAIGLSRVLFCWGGLATLAGAALLACARRPRLPVRPRTQLVEDETQPPPVAQPQLAAGCPCVTVSQTYAVKVDPCCPWHGSSGW